MFGLDFALIAGVAMAVIGTAYMLWRRRARRIQAEAAKDRLYPLW